MKVAIITLNGYSNYGNRLQNYALETFLLSLGIEVNTVFKKNNSNNRLSISSIKSYLSRYKNYSKKKMLRKKEKAFLIFIDKFTHLTQYDCKIHYDYYIVGSDQVWNPNFKDVDDFMFLEFVEDKSKKVSFSASFGINELPDSSKAKYQMLLNNFEYISVREETGQMIIKELLLKDVPVLVDPTMLLTSQEWISISNPHKYKPIKPYLLTYFLGDQGTKNKAFIKKYAKDNNLEIVNLGDVRDKKTYIIGPSEFVDYYKDAEIIFTDSFHGTVFSILFKRPFIVFHRGNMNSRIETLLDKFQLQERHWNNIDNIINVQKIDYSQTDLILESEYKKAVKFIKIALNI